MVFRPLSCWRPWSCVLCWGLFCGAIVEACSLQQLTPFFTIKSSKRCPQVTSSVMFLQAGFICPSLSVTLCAVLLFLSALNLAASWLELTIDIQPKTFMNIKRHNSSSEWWLYHFSFSALLLQELGNVWDWQLCFSSSFCCFLQSFL